MVFVLFWELFRFRNGRNIIPFILLPIAEWTEWKECGLLGIGRIRVLYGNFWRKILRGRSSSQVTSDSVSRSETCRSVLFEIEIPCILLFLNRNKNSQNSPKRMHPKIYTISKKMKNNQQLEHVLVVISNTDIYLLVSFIQDPEMLIDLMYRIAKG